MNEYIKKAEKFLVNCIQSGLATSYCTKTNKWVKEYPEVTGYVISYFAENYSLDEIPKAVFKCAEKLEKLQNPKGGFCSFYNKNFLYTFDTAQIMHGFIRLYQKTQEQKYIEIAIKCGDFICEMQLENGGIIPMFNIELNAKYINKNGGWGGNLSYIQVKNIEGLLLLAQETKQIKYVEVAQKLKCFGKEICSVEYTHPGAYCLEGLYAVGEEDFVRAVLQKSIIPRIKENGFLSYEKSLPYAYVSGTVQMAILLAKLDFKEEAKSIQKWARIVQSNDVLGGLYQYADSDGNLDKTIHQEVNSWGTKYFAQLERILC